MNVYTVCFFNFNIVQNFKTFYVSYLAKGNRILKYGNSQCMFAWIDTPVLSIVLYLINFISTWNLWHWISVSEVYLNANRNVRNILLLNNSYSSCWIFLFVGRLKFREKSERSSLHANTWFIILDLLLCEICLWRETSLDGVTDCFVSKVLVIRKRLH